jgi:hypothetical protein
MIGAHPNCGPDDDREGDEHDDHNASLASDWISDNSEADWSEQTKRTAYIPEAGKLHTHYHNTELHILHISTMMNHLTDHLSQTPEDA